MRTYPIIDVRAVFEAFQHWQAHEPVTLPAVGLQPQTIPSAPEQPFGPVEPATIPALPDQPFDPVHLSVHLFSGWIL